MANLDDAWQRIAVSRDGAVTTLRLHTDGGSLVWDAAAHRELADIWGCVASDRDTRAVILTGTGDDFCTEIRSPSGVKPWYDIWSEGRRIVSGMLDVDVPIITAVNGPATIHAELCALGDVVLACPESTFADHAHAVRGVVPGDGAQVVWRNLLGPSRGTYFLLTGAVIDCDEALRLGVVHEVHPRDRLLERAHEIALALTAAMPPPVMAYALASLRSDDRRRLADAVPTGLALAGLAKYSVPPS